MLIGDIYSKPAVFGEGPALTYLALRSKSYWPYDQEYLKRCWKALEIDDDYIQKYCVRHIVDEDKIIGYFSLAVVAEENRLDNLWIKPEYIRTGVGSKVFPMIIEEAKALGWKSFRLAADTYAQGFYEKMGCHVIGKVRSKISNDIYLIHMQYDIR